MSLGGALSTLLLLAAGYGALVLFVYLTQSSLLYLPNLPSRNHQATPQAIGLAYEAVTLTAEDGVELDAWYIPAEQARGVVLFFHGNAGNISHRLDSLAIFHRLGLSSLIIDYRGYGQSQGSPSEAGTYRDAEAAWRYLTEGRGMGADKIVLFGRSLGAAVAAELATRHRPAGLILESAFTSVPELAADVYPFLPARWLSRFHYRTEAYLKDISTPVLVVHSPDDEIIPFHHGQRLFAAAREPKQFLPLRGGHNEGFLLSAQAYEDGLNRFFIVALATEGSR